MVTLIITLVTKSHDLLGKVGFRVESSRQVRDLVCTSSNSEAKSAEKRKNGRALMLRACLMVALGGRGGDRSRRHKSGRSISSEKAWMPLP